LRHSIRRSSSCPARLHGCFSARSDGSVTATRAVL
jgi:hypothetical protein